MKGDTDNQLCTEVNERGCYLLETAQYLDCTFLVGLEPHQEEIASHKLILAMASRVFEAMFYGDLSEKNNPIHVTDIQPETFKLLLQYIYTGNVNMNSVDEACNLYYAAKKYMLQHLLEECSRYLWDYVNTSNVWQLLEFAQHYKEEELLLKCEKIFSMDTLDVLNDSKFEDAELNTVLTVFSFDNLNIDSETHLIKAAARYAKAHNMRVTGRDIDQSPSDGSLTEMSTSAPTLNSQVNGVNAENDPEPVVETLNVGDSRKQLESGAQAVDPGAPAIEESTKIKGIIEKIRFLCLTPVEFAECSERTSILSMSEEIAVIMNLTSNKCNVPLPSHFSKCTFRRNIWRDCSDEKDDSRRAGSFTYTVYGFTHLNSVLSPPCYVLIRPWQLNVTKDENGCPKLSVQYSGLKNSNWSCEVNIVLRICKTQPEFSFQLFGGSSKVQNPASFDDYIFNATHLFCRERSAYFFPADTVNWISYINKDGSVKFTVELKEKEREAKQMAVAPNLFNVDSRPRASRNLSDRRIISPRKKILRMILQYLFIIVSWTGQVTASYVLKCIKEEVIC